MSHLFIFSPMKENKEVRKCVHPKHFLVSGIEIRARLHGAFQPGLKFQPGFQPGF